MNIGFVTPFFSKKAGGSAVSPYLIAKYLAKNNNIYVFTSNLYRDYAKFDDESNLNIIEIPIQYKLYNIFYTPSLKGVLELYIKNLDILHMHNYRTYQNIIALKLAMKYNVPYIVQPHGSLPNNLSKNNLKIMFDMIYGKTLLNNASKLVALNEMEYNQFKQLGFKDEKISIIPNGIELINFKYLPKKGIFKKKYGIEQNKKIILFLGRIHKIKGIDILLKSFQLLKGNDNFVLIIAGPNDGYLNECVKLANNLKISDKVIFTGSLYEKYKLEAYIDSEVFVLPSYYEIWGLTILEAYACRKPVIASNINGLKELVINEQTGLLFESQNIRQLSHCISDLLSDNKKSKWMGNNGNNFVIKYDISNSVKKLENIYQNCVRSHA